MIVDTLRTSPGGGGAVERPGKDRGRFVAGPPDLYDRAAMSRLAVPLLALSYLACSQPKAWDPALARDRQECTLGVTLPNMACSDACPTKVKAAIGAVRGVEEVQVDYEARRATVYARWPACGEEGYQQMVDNLYRGGYSARIVSAR